MTPEDLIISFIVGYVGGHILIHSFYRYKEYKLKKMIEKSNELMRPIVEKMESVAYSERRDDDEH